MSYELLDGTKSTDYKIGDKFIVDVNGTFSRGSVVSLYEDDGSSCPLFKLEEGECKHNCFHDGSQGAYEDWGYMKRYKSESTKKEKVIVLLEYCYEYREGDSVEVLIEELLKEGYSIEEIKGLTFCKVCNSFKVELDYKEV